MQTTGWMGGFYTFSQWVTRMVYVNLLWILFSVTGLLLFGFFPATASMFAVIRKWFMGEEDIPVWKAFWSFYKKDFLKTNLIGYAAVILGFFLYMDYRFIQFTSITLYKFLLIPLLIVIVLFLFMCLYLFPTFVHYEMNFFQVYKNAFLTMIINPMANLLLMVGILGLYFLISALPGFLPFLGGSAYAFVIMGSSYYAFRKVERGQASVVNMDSLGGEGAGKR